MRRSFRRRSFRGVGSSGGKRPPFNFRTVLTFGLLALVVIVVVGIISRFKEIMKFFERSSLFGGALKMLGIELSGEDAASQFNDDEAMKYAKSLVDQKKISVYPRHHDYANSLRKLFSEGRPFAAFFTEHISDAQAFEVGKLFREIIKNTGYSIQTADGGVDMSNPVYADALDNEFAALYYAYGISQMPNRDIPLIGLLFKNTKGSVVHHCRRFLPDRFYSLSLEGVTIQVSRSGLLNWFVENPYLNGKK